MKKFLFSGLVGLALLISYFLPNVGEPGLPERPSLKSVQGSLDTWSPSSRTVTPILGNPSLGSTPEEVAERYVDLHREQWGVKKYHRLHPTIFRTPLGTRINYSVYQGQIPIIELGIRIQVDRFLQVSKVENEYRPLERATIPEDLTGARQVAEGHLGDNYQVDDSAGLSEAPVLVPVTGSDEPVLAFVIPAREKNTRRRPVQLLLRADDGQVLRRSVSRVEFH